MLVRAAVLEDRRIDIRTLQLDPPRAGEVLVRLVATGVCHTDLSIARGNLPSPVPVVLGHEGAGVVEAVGDGVTLPAVGDHVVCTTAVTCGQCYMCVRSQLPCDRGGAVAFAGTMTDGTVRLHDGDRDVHHVFCQSSFAEYTVVPARACAPVRHDAPLDRVAALACGVSTGLSVVINRAQVTPGASVLILGAGGVGLSAVMGARLVGAAHVIVADIAVAKLAKAKEIGADTVVDSGQVDLVETVLELTGGRGVDFAVDCVGAPGTLDACFRAIRAGGIAVAAGIMHASVSTTIDARTLLRTEKRITGTYAGSVTPLRDVPRFTELYMTGRLDIDALIDRQTTLADVARTLDDLEAGAFTRAVIIH
jgi:Zn-dependent alcohol dehydrogenase